MVLVTVVALIFAVAAVVTLRSLPAVLRELPPEPPPCAHEWSVAAETVVPPMKFENVEYQYGGELQQLIEASRGSTHVVMTCKKCGALKTTKLPGRPSK